MVNRFMMAQSAVEMRRWGAPAIVTLAAMAAMALDGFVAAAGPDSQRLAVTHQD